MARTALCLGASSASRPTAWRQQGLRCPVLRLATQGCPASLPSLVPRTAPVGVRRRSLAVCSHESPGTRPEAPGRVPKHWAAVARQGQGLPGLPVDPAPCQASGQTKASFLLGPRRGEAQGTERAVRAAGCTCAPGRLQARLTFGGEVVAAQGCRVALHGVEARRHQHHVRAKLIRDWHDDHSAKGRRRRHGVS